MANPFNETVAAWVAGQGDAELRLGNDTISASDFEWSRNGAPGIYAPKSRSILTRLSSKTSNDAAIVIGDSGVPTGGRRKWLVESSAKKPILFLGDLDGVDISIYCSLINRPAPAGLKYLGICDNLLDAFDVSLTSLEGYMFPVTAIEVAAIRTLGLLGFDVEAIVGPRCLSVLRAGKKLELEGLLWEISADKVLKYAMDFT